MLSLLHDFVYIGHSKTMAMDAEMYLQHVKTSNQGHLTSSALTWPHSTDCMLSEIRVNPELAVIQWRLTKESKETIYSQHSHCYCKNLCDSYSSDCKIQLDILQQF